MAAALVAAAAAHGQAWTQRGFFEMRHSLFPREAPGDSGRVIAEGLLRYEATWKPRSDLRLNVSFDARTDSHRQFERSARLDWRDRSLLRPAFSARRYSLSWNRGGLTLEAGRQFIRWGKADILNPTDRFAPRDFLNVINTEFLGVVAARATYERGGDTLDLVWQPAFTPSRSPLLNQRWVVLPREVRQFPIDDRGFLFPGRGNAGARWNHLGSGYEFSLSFFDGFNHLPLIDANPRFFPSPAITLARYFARMRMYGADAAIPLRWFTLKAESAYFTSPTPQADEYVQYVAQAERQMGEWVFVGGYAGEAVTRRRSPLDFAPDRGLTRTLLGRVSYNLDANRSVAFESAVRQNGRGFYGKLEYSQAMGAHWRATLAGILLGGRENDFLGQFRRNSHIAAALRYSF
jgi:hypothetical protein